MLAGGGTAGHTSPLLATADALRRLRPDRRGHRLGTARGLETRWSRRPGYPLELIPPVPLPRRPNADLLAVPGRLRGAVERGRRGAATGSAPTWWSASAATSRRPAYLAARRRGVPIVVHERNALPGLANRLGARLHAARRHVASPTPRCRTPSYVGLPLRRDDRRRSTGPRCAAEARATFGLDRRPARPCWSPAARRARGGSTSAVAGRPGALLGAGVQVLHVRRARRT